MYHLSESSTRKQLIDQQLAQTGWGLADTKQSFNVHEYPAFLNRRIPPNTNQQESVILKQLDQSGMITAAQVMHLLSVKERRAREILKQLSEKHLLEKRGSARSTYYTKINH